jgi:predicted nucleotidyltransferase
MSADVPTVILTGPAMVPLVRAAAALEAEDIPPFAVIGGVAVTVRLGRAVRATADIDAVTDQRYTPTALEVLRARADVTYDAADPHTITIAGAEVQFQDVEPVDDADVAHLDDKDLLYVAAHAHALAAATRMRLLATDGQIEATVPVATVGALLATKLHAYLDRRRVAGPDKRPGDLWDIYNLLLRLGGDAAADLAANPSLAGVVARTFRDQLIVGAARARAVLLISNDERYQAITAEEISYAAAAFLDSLGER